MIRRWLVDLRSRRLRKQRVALGLPIELPIDRTAAEALIHAEVDWPGCAPTITETVHGYSANWMTRPMMITTLDAFTGELQTRTFGPR